VAQISYLEKSETFSACSKVVTACTQRCSKVPIKFSSSQKQLRPPKFCHVACRPQIEIMKGVLTFFEGVLFAAHAKFPSS
jgi:hypothetical protein